MSNEMIEPTAPDVKADATDASVERLLFDVIAKIHMLHNLTTAGFNRRQDNGLHVSHFSVLNHLANYGDAQPPQRLAARMNLTKATMTSNLNKLSERGFVAVRENPHDKRSKLVFLTPAGRKEREAAIQRAMGGINAYLENLTPDDVRQATAILDKLHVAMSAADGDPH
ncbi:MAG: winged helix-turn-helix transcriptional regulator [Parvularculaceae bacterium]|nr:winged helix-turn-helix transcriptional regulator [Parvularculaceae bacterium]